MKTIYILVIVFGLIFFYGCTPYDSIVNYKEADDYKLTPHQITNYSPITLQSSDILSIEISNADKETVEVFNNYQSTGFLIDIDGYINFPIVGKILLAGKTLEEARREISGAINKYFKTPPTVNVMLSNFTVIVNGEVSSPQKIDVQNDRISIIEAITSAGDFTAYSKRDSVLVIREENGERLFGYVDFNSSKIFESPYFYLKQNDVIYVKPEKRLLGTVRTRQDKIIPYVSVGISVILLSFTIARNR